MSLRIVTAADVRSLLPMCECIDVMDSAMRSASSGGVSTPPRIITPLIDKTGYFALMPGSMLNPSIYGAKVVSLHPDNPSKGRAPVQGFVTLFDHETGAPIAIIEGGEITAIRTAATSGLATRELARADACSHGIFGTGVQAATHIDAISCIREIETVRVWGRDFSSAMQFAIDHSERTGLRITAVESAAEAAACDIITTATSASEPVLFGEWLSAGCHINLVGAHTPITREVDSDVIARSRVYVDLMESALREAGDLLIPMEEGCIAEKDVAGEIGQVLTDEIAGRTDDKQITVYKSLGIVAQDLFAAEYVLRAAEAQDVGRMVGLN